jgi:hypothetical protein
MKFKQFIKNGKIPSTKELKKGMSSINKKINLPYYFKGP